VKHGLRRIVIVGAGALLLTFFAGVAVASVPDANGVIHACVKTTDGSIRIMDASTTVTCPKGYAPLDWEAAPRPGTLYGFHHAPGQTFDVLVGEKPQTFTVECPNGEVMISATGILYRLNGQEYRAEPPTEEAGNHATFSFFNPYPDATQIQINYNCAKIVA
jgi:hypothetical protein